MSILVYCLHCSIVFAVPPLFGWTLLRRVFREANLLAVIPVAIVVGLTSLMAIVNELRFVCEMGTAVWFAYKVLLALTLVVIVVCPRRPPSLRCPGCGNSSWKLLLLASGAVVVGVYYGIPAFHGYLNDAWWYHYPAAVQIQDVERFPLAHVFALDDPLYYHYGPDILAACWSFLLEKSVQTAWGLNIVIFAPCAFLLAFALVERISRNYWGSLIGAMVMIAGGNLRFLLFLTGRYTDSTGGLRVFNSQSVQGLLQMVFTPSHLIGIPLALVILLLFRHFSSRPSLALGGVLGLFLGTLTLVAEWYFLPLLAGFILVMGYRLWRIRITRGLLPMNRVIMVFLPAIVAVFVGSFNNTYLAGAFGHFWMHYPSATEVVSTRRIIAEINHTDLTRNSAATAVADLRDIIGAKVLPPISKDKNSDLTVPNKIALDNRNRYNPGWTVPNLVPLRLNFAHFGKVPSWESAASNEDSFIPIFSTSFLMEAAPVLLIGIPFGLWVAWRQRNPNVILLAWLAAVSVLPPIFLDWGYRSTDFLRFFTASFSYAALFFGWLIGDLLTKPAALRSRLVGGALIAGALLSPVGLGIIGLMPGTLDAVKAIASTARSLSQVRPTSMSLSLPASEEAARKEAFESLAIATGDFLFPLTKGRDRAIVIVPPDQVPETKYFPEWMKMATLSRIQLPVGWHWENSIYSAYYRDAVTRLDATAITALGAKWVITSNVFQDHLPLEVAQALSVKEHFVPVARFKDGQYVMSVFRVMP